jgi:hypothetical protein
MLAVCFVKFTRCPVAAGGGFLPAIILLPFRVQQYIHGTLQVC